MSHCQIARVNSIDSVDSSKTTKPSTKTNDKPNFGTRFATAWKTASEGHAMEKRRETLESIGVGSISIGVASDHITDVALAVFVVGIFVPFPPIHFTAGILFAVGGTLAVIEGIANAILFLKDVHKAYHEDGSVQPNSKTHLTAQAHNTQAPSTPGLKQRIVTQIFGDEVAKAYQEASVGSKADTNGTHISYEERRRNAVDPLKSAATATAGIGLAISGMGFIHPLKPVTRIVGHVATITSGVVTVVEQIAYNVLFLKDVHKIYQQQQSQSQNNLHQSQSSSPANLSQSQSTGSLPQSQSSSHPHHSQSHESSQHSQSQNNLHQAPSPGSPQHPQSPSNPQNLVDFDEKVEEVRSKFVDEQLAKERSQKVTLLSSSDAELEKLKRILVFEQLEKEREGEQEVLPHIPPSVIEDFMKEAAGIQ